MAQKINFNEALDMREFGNMPKVRETAIQAAPASKIKAEFAINNKAKALHPDFQKFIVDEIVSHSDAAAKTFILKRADGKPAAYFRAGQYISLKLSIGDSFVTRPYSISSSPKDALEGKIAVTVRSNPGGFVADWLLDNLKTGDEVTASDAQGQFYYESLRDCENVIALAGGSGITPFLSMAAAIRDGIEDFNLTIIYGNRTEESILFHDELDKICRDCEKVKVVYVLSDEEKAGFKTGFITADIIKEYAPENFSVFICGPEAMYSFLNTEIEKLGLPKRLVRRENLGVTKKVWEQQGYPADIRGKDFKIIIRQGGEEFTATASADETVLTAIERSGIKAPSRCRSGECGWCRSKLVSGEVFVPEDNEGRRWSDINNRYIHPCSSFPVSDLIIEVPGEYLN